VVLAPQRPRERFLRRFQRVDPARVERRQRRLAAHSMERRATLRPRFRQHERPFRKIERGKSGGFRARGFPVEAPGDHQVEDEKQPVVEREHDPFSEAAERPEREPAERIERRVDGAEEKGGGEANSEERVARAATHDVFDVDRDVGEFGHTGMME